MKRSIYGQDHDLFRASVRRFIDTEVVPRYADWERAGVVDKSMFRTAAAQGFLGMEVDPSFGGGGVSDFRYNAIISEEAQFAGVGPAMMCISLHNDICLPYFTELANPEQQERWLPGIVDGSLMTAVAMTEPGTGSDLAGMTSTAIRKNGHYVLNGSKTFITNGINSSLVVVAAKTEPSERHAGMSLLVVEDGMPGFERGRNLDKMGLHAQDTAELFFTDVHVPIENLLGVEGQGFRHLVQNLPRERLSLAVGAVAATEAAFGWTLDYVKERKAFGASIGSNQTIKHTMAEYRTLIDIAWTYLDRQIEALNEGTLTAEDAAKAKWWTTELQNRMVEVGVQFHGGYGYMNEYPIARAYVDARVQTIYGGTNEIMKEIIGRSLGL